MTSPADNHASPADNHTLPVNNHALPVNNHALSVNNHALPVNNHALPVNNHALSVNNHALSVNNHTLPVNNHTLPVNNHTLPVNNHTLPLTLFPFRAVKYNYDFANRLITADFGKANTPVGNSNTSFTDNTYDGTFGYNKESMAISFGQGEKAASPAAYVYEPGTHKLNSITGLVLPNGKDRSNPHNYVYDGNGNIIEDKALLRRIEYDYRNLPVKITHYTDNSFNTPKTITEFIYDASGNRVMKIKKL